MAIHPYLMFSGDCRQAFERYHEIFGGELTVSTFADVPEDASMPGVPDDGIMHVNLTSGDNVILGSDDPTGDGGPKVGMSVAYVVDSFAEGEKVFAALAEGGEVSLPFGETFWSKGFGMCTDRFGVPWMVDTAELS